MITYYSYVRKLLLILGIPCGILALTSFVRTGEKNLEGVVFENDFVLITSKMQQCTLPKDGTDNVNLLLSVKNKTAGKIAVSFHEDLFYDGNCVTCGKEEYRYTIELEPNAVKEAFCGDRSLQGLTIFHHMPSGLTRRTLTDFDLSEVTVTQLK